MKKKEPFDSFPSDDLDDFDSLEARIRGEEILLSEEYRKTKEQRAVTEELKDQEINKRLKELKESIHRRSKK
ncbi:MAG: hypothetical protein C5B54_07915 [Acidobacteria bacterium]|nr:MAG: hypothetical protein C5B54_07915 [Acidobacteriota bacterium]